MNDMLKTIIRLLVGAVLLGVCQLVSAQSADNDRNLEVNLWFLFLDESRGAFYFKNGSNYELLSSGPYAVERPNSFKSGERIEIYKEIPEGVALENERNGPVRIKVAEIKAPSNIEAALIVLAPIDPNDKTSRLTHRVYEESPSDRSNGTIKLINLGRSKVAAAIGAERVVLDPGETKTVRAPTDDKSRVRLQVADNIDGKWEIIERRFLFLRPGERMTGVLVYSPSGMKHLYGRGELASMGGNLPPAHAWLQYKH